MAKFVKVRSHIFIVLLEERGAAASEAFVKIEVSVTVCLPQGSIKRYYVGGSIRLFARFKLKQMLDCVHILVPGTWQHSCRADVYQVHNSFATEIHYTLP